MKHHEIIALMIILRGIISQQCGGYFNIFLSTSITAYEKKKILLCLKKKGSAYKIHRNVCKIRFLGFCV